MARIQRKKIAVAEPVCHSERPNSLRQEFGAAGVQRSIIGLLQFAIESLRRRSSKTKTTGISTPHPIEAAAGYVSL
jgi:hypothetical protein